MSGETEILKDSLQKLMVENSKVKSSLGEIIIISTEDKIELCLMKHLGDLENKRGWITPFGLLLTVFLTFLTTDFKEWYISKETWQAIFLIAEAIFLGWLIIAVIKARRTKSVKDILEEIKKSSIKFDDEGKIDEDIT
jgi:hypothetical protein